MATLERVAQQTFRTNHAEHQTEIWRVVLQPWKARWQRHGYDFPTKIVTSLDTPGFLYCSTK